MTRIARVIALALVLILLFSLTTACQNDNKPGENNNSNTTLSQPIVKTSFLLGTLVEIKVYNKVDEAVIDKAFERIADIENRMTINNAETSEIIELNSNSGQSEVKVGKDTFYVLERGRYYSELSKGRFDITVGPIVKLWNIGTDIAAVPDENDLKEQVKLIGYDRLQLDPAAYTAELSDKGMKVDLGAIAKGYAADEAGRVLRENGVKNAIIYLGGNLLTIGGNPNGNPWRIGIQDPFSARGDFMGIVQVNDQTVVTSGTYERYFEENGKIYHHILDPRTGYPVENNLNSVSIVTDKSIDGDGLSTTILLLGLEEGMKFIENLEGIEAIFVTNDKLVYLSSGLKKNFIIANSDFILQD